MGKEIFQDRYGDYHQLANQGDDEVVNIPRDSEGNPLEVDGLYWVGDISVISVRQYTLHVRFNTILRYSQRRIASNRDMYHPKELVRIPDGVSPFSGEKITTPIQINVNGEILPADISDICKDYIKSDFSGAYFDSEYVPYLETSDGKIVCEYDITEGITDDYFVCDECGEVLEICDSNDIDTTEGCKTVCDGCMDSYVWCEHEVIYTRDDDAVPYDGEYYTYDFFYSNTEECTNCGDRFFTENGVYTEDTDRFYCHDCAEEELIYIGGEWYEEPANGYIEDYGYRPTPQFHGTGDKYIGMEWEVDAYNGHYADADANEIFGDDDLWYCKEDGSLVNGFEAVSHPATVKYWLENVNFVDKCEQLIDKNYTRKDTAGIHFHVNRNFFKRVGRIGNIIRFFEENYDDIVEFARRDEGNALRWADKYGAVDVEGISGFEWYAIADSSRERYKAVNLQPRNTIEFRIFNTTLDPDLIKAYIQFIDVVTDLANQEGYTLSWDSIYQLGEEKEYSELLEKIVIYC